ncbi:Trafficking protein particle complex subunit 33 [Nakaseomyces glabratus]|nr:Transport protein particle (TRAPP) component [Nakaseomyces glabratus]KAI8392582.1 Transport protein particle (TRAPP) component [Nakaseomyces glabratus]KTB14576.1 Trafficking protein particle complex subunit 33 [Nakaseomyces glabratus]KTB20336.1 Trafficking protein particle complex subunit 33 [Nakaseomyces glabratus]QNG16065.1 uncharacterized protein GWK60_L02541 [Nakaseomyces glabratus]
MERREPTEHQSAQQQAQLFEKSLPKVNQLAFNMLLNELVPLSMAVENDIHDMAVKDSNAEDVTVEVLAGDVDKKVVLKDDDTEDEKEQAPKYKIGEQSHKLIQQIYNLDDEYRSNSVAERIQNVGFQIGSKLCELLVFSNNPTISFRDMDLLAVMKFVCRDVWKQVYGKQIDNLKTNHRGTFYLLDYDYKPIQTFALDLDPEQQEKELKLVEPFLEIPVGIIKGVLSSLGFPKDEVICVTSFVDRPDDRPRSLFPKGVSFHVQVNRR